MDRSDFIKTMGLTAGALMFAPAPYSCTKSRNKVKFGVIADLHHDIMHDAPERLQAFITQMQQEKADFIIQLGDFCRPYDYNNALMDIWNSFPGERYHVIGNHDMDGGFSREQVVEFWNAKGKYYSYDQNGFHFVVLDGNEHNPSPDRPGGYARYISNTQMDWLSNDLQKTALPTIVLCHQGLDNDSGGLGNGTLVRYTLEQANASAGFQKVILVLTGHHHQDYYNRINDIHYVQINSASYQWLGDDYKHVRYSEAVDKSHPWIKYTVPYRDPLWALIEIDTRGTIEITGRKTEFVGPSPKDLKVDLTPYIYPIVPQISNRKIKVNI